MSLHAVERGRGPAIVLVHGWPVTGAMWDEQLEALSDEFRVIAVDLPGFGSSPPVSPSSITGLALALEAFLAAHDLRRALLAGWSMGAGVVMRYCEQVGLDRLAGVALVEDSPRLQPAPDWPAGEYTTFSDAAVGAWLDAWADGRRREVLEEMLALGFDDPRAHRLEIERLVGQGLEADPAAALESFRDAIEADFRAGLPALAVPALLVYGRASRMSTPPVHAYMGRTIPGAELHVLDGSGHCPMWERRQAFNELLREFARRALSPSG